MSQFGDDILSPVVNVGVVSNRIGTPLKADNRSGTPQRSGSANRAGSRGKGISFVKSVTDAENSKRSLRVVSVRRERRWENEHFVGATGVMRISDPKEYEEIIRHGNNILHGSKEENTFKEILQSENSDLLKIFLSCQERLFLTSEYCVKPAKMPRKVKAETEFQQATKSWNKIDKRLKDVALKTLDRSEILRSFVSGLEAVLLIYSQLGYAPPIPEPLVGILSISLRPMRENSVGLNVMFDHSIENVTLYRLLVHTICQFHGFKSQSNGNGDSRSTLVFNSKPIAIETRLNEANVLVAVTSSPDSSGLHMNDIKIDLEGDYVMVNPSPPVIADSDIVKVTSEVEQLQIGNRGCSNGTTSSALTTMSLLTFLVKSECIGHYELSE
jgi:hypothetical protein